MVLAGAVCALVAALWLLSLRDLSFSVCVIEPPASSAVSRAR